MLGLDDSGKTSFLKRVGKQEYKHVAATPRFNLLDFQHKGYQWWICELAGKKEARKFWTQYAVPDILAWVVDQADEDRLRESIHELNNVLAFPDFEKCHLLIICTKDDLPGLGQKQIASLLKVNQMKRKWAVMSVSTFSGHGVTEFWDVLNMLIESKNPFE